MRVKIVRSIEVVSLVVLALNLGCRSAAPAPVLGHPLTSRAQPVQRPAPGAPPQVERRSTVVDVQPVPAYVKEPPALYRTAGRAPEGLSIPPFERPTPEPGEGGGAIHELAPALPTEVDDDPAPAGAVAERTAADHTFESTDFDTNDALTGFLFIPPDCHAAAGPADLVTVANATIQFHDKFSGSAGYSDSLKNFFTALSPATFTFDPKVLYDQYAGRWVVVTLEQTTSPNSSRIFLAVSDDSDPAGSWFATAINSRETISAVDSWLDYPGFAVDEEAVYVTGNMFPFAGGFSNGERLFVVAKGIGSGGLYDGGAASVSKLDPYGGGGLSTTSQPAHVYGTPPAGVGTYLMSYSGLHDGTDVFLQWVRIDDPLGAPTFTQGFVTVGTAASTDNIASALPLAPQSGTATTLATNDRRAIDALWRADRHELWVTADVLSPSGADSGQTTALWARLTANGGTPSLADHGIIGGESIATGAFTSFPSMAVAADGTAYFDFSASASSISPGSYATYRLSGDAAGSTRTPITVHAGTDFYVRTFGNGSNRWGDYSGAALDPTIGCAWVYNEYATTRGTSTNPPPEDGRWATTIKRICANVIFDDGFELGDPSLWSTHVP